MRVIGESANAHRARTFSLEEQLGTREGVVPSVSLQDAKASMVQD